MKLLICGAGRATRALLARLGEGWDVTVLDTRNNTAELPREFEAVRRVLTGDASSPVVLDRAGLAEHDWVLAFTPDDEVNLAVVRFAVEAGVPHVVGRVTDPGRRSAMEQLGARPFSDIGGLARDVVQYLRNPRVRVIPVARERGEVIEIEVGPRGSVIGKTPLGLRGESWLLAGVFRDGALFGPQDDIVFREGDVLITVGPPDQFRPVCSLLECGENDFPRAYGQALLLCLTGDDPERDRELLAESMRLVQALMIEQVVVLGGEDSDAARETRDFWAGKVTLELRPLGERPYAQLEAACGELSVGLAVVPRREAGLLASLVRRSPLKLAQALPCPLWVSRGAGPGKRILVPFNGAGNSGLALEIAVQIAQRLGGEVAVAVVGEPDFMHGDGDGDWVRTALTQARELARGRGATVETVVREGNPVREITALAGDYDLMVLGSSDAGGLGFLTPDVGEHLLDRAPCTVLVVTG